MSDKSFFKLIAGGALFIMCVFLGIAVHADSFGKDNYTRIVRVPFFPMDGYHEYSGKERTGLDVEYLDAICAYTKWKIDYVECSSWNEALEMLDEHRVDFVGTAQYSIERALKYDYADLSSGYTFGALVVNGTSSLAYEDFESMVSKRIGVVKSYIRKPELIKYLNENGVTEPNLTEYETTRDLQNALANGEIDIAAHTFMEIRQGQRIVGRFASSQYYYITYKNNDEMLSELNDAIAALKMEQPTLESELTSKYYNSKLGNEIVLSAEEKEYVRMKKKLVVAYPEEFYPFSYIDGNTYKGISRDFFDTLKSKTGIDIKYVPAKTMDKAAQMVIDGTADVSACYIFGSDAQGKGSPLVFNKYISVPLALIVKADIPLDKVKRIASVKYSAEKMNLFDNNLYNSVSIYETEQECIKAIVNGDADAAICNSYLSSFYINSLSQNVELRSILQFDDEIGIAVSSNAEEVLNGLLDKFVSNLDDQRINDYMIKNTIKAPFILKAWVFKYRLAIALGAMIIILIVLLTVLRMLNDAHKIQKLMYRDAELNIWNMNYFLFWSCNQVKYNRYKKYAIVYTNIVQFKIYGTLYGWKESNKLLKAMSDILAQVVNGRGEIYARGKTPDENISEYDEIYARSQGDHFILMLTYENEAQLLKRLNSIIRKLEEELHRILGIHITINMGVSFVTSDSHDLKDVVNKAIQALECQSMKNASVSGIQIYDKELSEELKKQHEKEELMENADIYEDFVTYYQAKVDINTEKVVGAEAVVRYSNHQNPQQIISPGFFIPYYEKTGKVKELDFFVFNNICQMLRRRMDEGKPVVKISCNFSRRHFAEEGFVNKLMYVIEKHRIPLDLIEVEITETIILEELQQERVYSTLDDLHKRGILLSIDDFGSGYSSLGVFERVPASVLKLDRSFFINHADKERQLIIMKQIVKLADELHAEVVCEGVETDEDVELMKKINAHIAQGYRYAKPVPEKDFEERLDTQ